MPCIRILLPGDLILPATITELFPLPPIAGLSGTGIPLLISYIILPATLDSGAVEMGLFLGPSLENLYTGAFTLHFDQAGTDSFPVSFLYMLDLQGVLLEYVSDEENIDGITAIRRSASPVIIYFYR
jgi:hypothetical protein